MALKSISITNFKAYKGTQEIPIKPITLIFGPNSAGKSSIVHALAFLKHVHLTSGNCSPNEVDLVWDKVTLGGWQNVLHGHDLKQSMSLGLNGIDWEFSAVGLIPAVTDCSIVTNGKSVLRAKNNTPGKLDWQMSFGEEHQVLLDQYVSVVFAMDGKPIQDPDALPHGLRGEAWRFLTGKGSKVEPSKALSNGEIFDWPFFDAAFREYLRTHPPIQAEGLVPRPESRMDPRRHEPYYEYRGLELDAAYETRNALREALKEGRGIQPYLTAYFDDCFVAALDQNEIPGTRGPDSFEKLINSHVHLGPSREAPPRDIDRQSLGSVASYGPWLELLENKERRDQVNDSLKRMGLNYELVTRWKETITYCPEVSDSPVTGALPNVEFRDSQEQLAFKIRGAQVTLSHRDLGYGVSMVLPILVALHSSKFRLITMEQPELHLHPKQQAELGDELIAAALQSEEPKQLLIETHSEHLILRILRRIRETTENNYNDWPDNLTKACPNGISPENVSVLYIEPPPEGSNKGSSVIKIPITHDGDFSKPWPGGFFAERDNELF